MAITKRQDIFDKMSQGKGVQYSALTASSGAVTVGLQGGAVKFLINSIGSTLWSTIKALPTPAGLTSPTRLVEFTAAPNSVLGSYTLGRAYLVGTLVLSSTGNKFTHDAATFPILKNQMGASTALNMWPFVLVTTATTTTAPQMILKASGGTQGYVNQAGSGVVGTKTHTFPAAATAVGTGMFLRLEDGDSSVQDITQIDVTVAAAAGAANIYLFEPYCTVSIPANLSVVSSRNLVFNPPSIPNIAPGTATSGTVTSFLCVVTNSGVTTSTSATIGYSMYVE